MGGAFGRFLGTLFLIAAGFAWGYHYASTSEDNAPIITVKLQNASGKKISSLHVIYPEGSVDFSDIMDGAAQTARFYAPKETNYRIEVTFDDRKMIETDLRFVERGLNAVETIKENVVEPNFKVNVRQLAE